MRTQIRERLEADGVHATISSRIKHIYSIYRKMYAQKLDIKDVAIDKRHVRRHGFDMSRDKIVVNYDVHVSFFEFSHAMGADVACSARNQNHISLLARPRTSGALNFIL